MKCKYTILIIFIVMMCLGGHVFAKYILTRDLEVEIKTEPFYFETGVENDEIQLIDNQAEISLTIKNNDGTNYNFYDTSYEISLVNNEKFEYTINDEKVTNKTINGNNLINEKIKINLTPKENSSLNFSESIDVKVTTLKPYKKEVTIPIEIFQKNYCWEYTYVGDYQTFIVPTDGIYKIELWGASGGHSMVNGVMPGEGYVGTGSYTAGEINLSSNNNLYVYIGGGGENASTNPKSLGGYNGGGAGCYDESENEIKQGVSESAGGGGGATDIRLSYGEWDNFDGLKSRIMVAAGGAGAIWNTKQTFISGGGLSTNIYNKKFIYRDHLNEAEKEITVLTPNATQTSGFKFGIGDDGEGIGNNDGSPGAGGGYYGGFGHYSATDKYNNMAGGGSSFISGHNGCKAISQTSTEDSIVHTDQSIHYSGYEFKNTKMIDGEGYNWTNQKEGYIGMPTQDGTSTMDGNTGNGYAKITFLGKD